MKVILISNLKKLGKIGDVITVKDGYARNFLIPQDFAIYYSEANYEIFKEKKAEIEAENATKKANALENQNKLKNKEIIIIENAGDDGKLYGSVSSIRLANIANDLIKSKDIKRNNVIVGEVIKNIGKYKITFELHPEVSFTKEIIIARTNEEAAKIKSGEWEKEQQEKLKSTEKEEDLIVVKKEEVKEEDKEEAKTEEKK
jgi:large subunit ribosomal protein L9